MVGPKRRSLHPLLLQRSYWSDRLQALQAARPSVLLIPRPELSSRALEVDEFRIRAHDGIRLHGLRAQSRIGRSSKPATIRLVGPSDLPEIHSNEIGAGETQFVLQEPAGRRLEDRVLDVLRVCQVAAQNEHVRADQVRLVSPRIEPDEFLIASQLLAEELPPIPSEGEAAGSLAVRRTRPA